VCVHAKCLDAQGVVGKGRGGQVKSAEAGNEAHDGVAEGRECIRRLKSFKSQAEGEGKGLV